MGACRPAASAVGPGPSALDEFLKRTRGAGGGGGGGFGGGLPGSPPPRSLWVAGVVLILVAWLIFTSFHAIAPQERGVVSHLRPLFEDAVAGHPPDAARAVPDRDQGRRRRTSAPTNSRRTAARI